jgi:hypothetical protein
VQRVPRTTLHSPQRTAIKQRPHQETTTSQLRLPSPWYITTGERWDAAGHDEARPSAFNTLLDGGSQKRLFEEWCDQAPTLEWLCLEDEMRPVYVRDLGRRLGRKDDVSAARREKAIALGTKEEERLREFLEILSHVDREHGCDTATENGAPERCDSVTGRASETRVASGHCELEQELGRRARPKKGRQVRKQWGERWLNERCAKHDGTSLRAAVRQQDRERSGKRFGDQREWLGGKQR